MWHVCVFTSVKQCSCTVTTQLLFFLVTVDDILLLNWATWQPIGPTDIYAQWLFKITRNIQILKNSETYMYWHEFLLANEICRNSDLSMNVTIVLCERCLWLNPFLHTAA